MREIELRASAKLDAIDDVNSDIGKHRARLAALHDEARVAVRRDTQPDPSRNPIIAQHLGMLLNGDSTSGQRMVATAIAALRLREASDHQRAAAVDVLRAFQSLPPGHSLASDGLSSEVDGALRTTLAPAAEHRRASIAELEQHISGLKHNALSELKRPMIR